MTDTGGKRFAAYALMYNSERLILRMIANCAPYVEKIYIAYSELPWAYNQKARNEFRNHAPVTFLQQSPHIDKIEVIQGVWDKDEDTRNAVLDKVRADGFDYLIIQDADEYYMAEDYEKLIATILENPDFDSYLISCRTFWKTSGHVIVDKWGKSLNGKHEVAVNCRKNVRFCYCRQTDAKSKLFLKIPCFHLSCVYSDEEMWEKINTWGHTGDFKLDKWFAHKWTGWNPLYTRNLHPTKPEAWYKAVKYHGKLPAEIEDFFTGATTHHFSPSDFLREFFWNIIYTLYISLGFRKLIKVLRRSLGKL